MVSLFEHWNKLSREVVEFVLRDVENLTWHGHEQPFLAGPALRMEAGLRWSSVAPSNLNSDFVDAQILMA